jgi:hypothetical protein
LARVFRIAAARMQLWAKRELFDLRSSASFPVLS